MSDADPVKEGKDGEKSASTMTQIAAFAADWKIVVALLASVATVWLNMIEQYNKDLVVNQKAVQFAEGEAMIARFWQDPANTINRIETTYPRHAFCSVLGVYLAEVSRSRRTGTGADPDISASAFLDANEAVTAEIEQIAENHGVSLCALRNTARVTAHNLVDDHGVALAEALEEAPGQGCTAGPPLPYCTALRTQPGPITRWFRVHEECTLAMHAHAENVCASYAATLRAGAIARREQESAQKVQDDLRRAAVETAPSSERQQAIIGPDSTCQPLRIYLQATSKAAYVRDARAALIAAGWQITVIDKVDAAPRDGDVRYYFAGQEPCAEALAKDAAFALNVGPTLAVTSLEGAYKSLPRGRMELWFPAGNTAD